MPALTALALLMSLALQWPVQIVLDFFFGPATPDPTTMPEEGNHA